MWRKGTIVLILQTSRLTYSIVSPHHLCCLKITLVIAHVWLIARFQTPGVFPPSLEEPQNGSQR